MNEFNERKIIRNRNVVREIDRNSKLEFRWSIVVGFIFAGLMCVYSWQQHRMTEFGYRIEALKKEAAQLEEARKKLYLEQATLESPARIYQLAQDKLGLAAPQAHQVIFATISAADAGQQSDALAWDFNREGQMLNANTETQKAQ